MVASDVAAEDSVELGGVVDVLAYGLRRRQLLRLVPGAPPLGQGTGAQDGDGEQDGQYASSWPGFPASWGGVGVSHQSSPP